MLKRLSIPSLEDILDVQTATYDETVLVINTVNDTDITQTRRGRYCYVIDICLSLMHLSETLNCDVTSSIGACVLVSATKAFPVYLGVILTVHNPYRV